MALFSGGKNTEHKICVLISSTTFVWNTSHTKKKWDRYDKKCTLGLMQSTLYSCTILMKLEFSRQIFEKSSYIKFNENPSRGSRVVPHGRTGGHTDMTMLTVAFPNFANEPKNQYVNVISECESYFFYHSFNFCTCIS